MAVKAPDANYARLIPPADSQPAAVTCSQVTDDRARFCFEFPRRTSCAEVTRAFSLIGAGVMMIGCRLLCFWRADTAAENQSLCR